MNEEEGMKRSLTEDQVKDRYARHLKKVSRQWRVPCTIFAGGRVVFQTFSSLPTKRAHTRRFTR